MFTTLLRMILILLQVSGSADRILLMLVTQS